MDESDQSKESDGEDGLLSSPRRKLLVGLGAVFGLSQLNRDSSDSTNSETDPHLREAEHSLIELRGSLDTAELSAPSQSGYLRDKIAEMTEQATQHLEQTSSTAASADHQVETVRAAIAYYTTLQQTLDESATLVTQLSNVEFRVLYHQGTSDSNPLRQLNTQELDTAISRFSNPQTDPETLVSQGRSLVPDHTSTVESINTQSAILSSHLAAQRAYLDTADMIEAGIRAHETSQFDNAQSSLEKAKETLSAGIPELKSSHRLSMSGLSLEQYAKLLGLRQRGVSKLLSVSHPSTPPEKRRAVSNDALDLFFSARRIVSSD